MASILKHANQARPATLSHARDAWQATLEMVFRVSYAHTVIPKAHAVLQAVLLAKPASTPILLFVHRVLQEHTAQLPAPLRLTLALPVFQAHIPVQYQVQAVVLVLHV